MLETQKVLDYLAEVASLGTGPGVALEGLPHTWELPLAEMRKNILAEPVTRAVHEAYAHEYPQVIAGAEPVEVVVVLVRARATGALGMGAPLLVLPATVDSLGHVAVRAGARATIPFERLSGDATASQTLCVCDRDAYRAHQLAMASLPDDGSWANAVARALDLFHAVSVLDARELDEKGIELIEDRCVMALCDHPGLANPAAQVLRAESRHCSVHGEHGLAGPLRELVFSAEKDEVPGAGEDPACDSRREAAPSPAGASEQGEGPSLDGASEQGITSPGAKFSANAPAEAAGADQLDPAIADADSAVAQPDTDDPLSALDDLETLPDDQLLSHKMLCGIPAHLPVLSEADHAAWAAEACQGPGDLAVVSAPQGSNALALALAAMANHLTEAALRGDAAPRMVCVGNPHTLAALATALDERPTQGLTAVPTRWLPRIAAGQSSLGATGAQGEKPANQRRALGSLPALAALVVADGETPDGRALVEHLGHAADGDAARYADPWYVPQATLHYLDCVSSFAGRRIREPREAAELLSERLRLVDQRRCELIDAYASVVRAAAHMGRRDRIVAEVGELRRAHSHVRARLAFWDDISRLNPARRPLMGLGTPDQRDLIARNRQVDEPLVEGATLLEQVCERYRTELERIESQIDRRRGESAMLARRVRAASPAGRRCGELIAELVELCALSTAQAELLESTMDGHDTTFGFLNYVLDKTVRSAEFWLALHVFEARWLERCAGTGSGHRGEGQDAGAGRAVEGPGAARHPAAGVGPAVGAARHPAAAAWHVSDLCPFVLATPEVALGWLAAEKGEPSAQPALLVVLDANELRPAEGLALLARAQQAMVAGATTGATPAAAFGPTSGLLHAQASVGEAGAAELEKAGLLASLPGSLLSVALRRAETARSAESGSSSLPGTSHHTSRPAGIALSRLVDVRGTCVELADLRSALGGCQLRADASETGSEAQLRAVAHLLAPLSHVLVPDSAWGQVGGSRRNAAEAGALVRWVDAHAGDLERLASLAPEDGAGASVAVVAPFAAQAELLRAELGGLLEDKGLSPALLDVLWLREAVHGSWPVVLMSATCGPEALDEGSEAGVRGALSLAAGAARDALVVFCGGAWPKSSHAAVASFMRRSLRVGRLFSVVHNPLGEATDGDEPMPVAGLRSKPLSLTTLLARMAKRGQIAQVPPTAEVNRALSRVGLIERVRDEAGGKGWRPTAAGREAGILATLDPNGRPFCSYTPAAIPVVASIVASM